LGATEQSHDIFKVFLCDAMMSVESAPEVFVISRHPSPERLSRKGLRLKNQRPLFSAI
jgi:hypothetical protein